MEPEREPSSERECWSSEEGAGPPAPHEASESHERTEPVRRGPGVAMRQAAIAMELPFALVGPVLVGGFVGYLFDRWLGSLPIGMLIGVALGFAAGVREVQRRMKSLDSRRDGR